MIENSAQSAAILHLADELLFDILDISRPDSFQSLRFTCRKLCDVGKSLLEVHGFCLAYMRKWRPRDKHRDSGFLEDLVLAPPKHRIRLLSYFPTFDANFMAPKTRAFYTYRRNG